MYSVKYDALYDKDTGEWLEAKCPEKECEFCINRPPKMMRGVLKIIKGVILNRINLKILRREALNKLFRKYPEGFTVRDMVDEFPKLYGKHKQAADFLAFVREEEGCIKMHRERTRCVYTYEPDAYKLLTELWRKSA